MSPLILVDGPSSDTRRRVAEDLAERFVTIHARGNILTTPETYVRMMAPAIDQLRPVVIECSWITQEQHAGQMAPVTREVFVKHRAQRRMLDRLALGCGALSIRVIDGAPTLRLLWPPMESYTLDTMMVGDWDEVFFQDIEYKLMNARNPGPGIGHWARHESILLVGDQHGDTAQPYNVLRNIAFCSMSGKGCSEWVTEQIAAAGISERSLYWINARSPKVGGGISTPYAFVEDLNPAVIIALGNIAEAWCGRLGRAFYKVPHPQSWKRFHHSQPYPLIDILKAVLEH
jgi:hypothetical protein